MTRRDARRTGTMRGQNRLVEIATTASAIERTSAFARRQTRAATAIKAATATAALGPACDASACSMSAYHAAAQAATDDQAGSLAERRAPSTLPSATWRPLQAKATQATTRATAVAATPCSSTS
jgi:hypothetical protein